MGRAPEDLPEELRRRESRLARIREAKAALEQEAREARAAALREQARAERETAADEGVDAAERKQAATRAAKAEAKAHEVEGRDDDQGPGSGAAGGDLPHHRVPANVDGTPKPGAQRNFTDPDSRIMVKGSEVLQGYNAQAAVDAECQVIVAVAVTNQPPDQEHLVPMLDRVVANCGRAPAVVSADNGYLSHENVEACAARGVDAYIAAGRDPAKTPPSGRPTVAQRVREAMAEKLRAAAGKAIDARRKAIVEPAFGLIKQAAASGASRSADSTR